MVSKTNRQLERARRHARVRNKISGTAERPRLCVFRSNTNIYVQIIDDVAGNTIVSASTLDKEVKTKHSNKEAAKEVGTLIAKRAIEKKIIEVNIILMRTETSLFYKFRYRDLLVDLSTHIHVPRPHSRCGIIRRCCCQRYDFEVIHLFLLGGHLLIVFAGAAAQHKCTAKQRQV